MIDSIIHFVKEYFAIIFYILIIFNIVIRVIVTKKNKKKKKKSRKGGGIGDVLLCIITFGWSCGLWQGLYGLFQDLEKKKEAVVAAAATPWSGWSRAPFDFDTWRSNPDMLNLWYSTTTYNEKTQEWETLEEQV
tara:strand:+ start:5007 stop:5408 length:402 start_codon:yes stop_codon:yes gene_type:complete